MKNTYIYNGKTYTLKELNLDTMHRAAPLLVRFKQEHYKLVKDLDTSELDCLKGDICELESAIIEISVDDTDNAELLEKLNGKLAELKKELSAPQFTALKKHLAELESLALLKVITDQKLMIEVLNGILTCSKGKPEITLKENINNDAFDFIKQVIADFFLLISKLSIK